MADDKRLQILKLISAQLETITPANGYQHDLSTDKVFRGRTGFGQDDPVPLVSLLEWPEYTLEFLNAPEGYPQKLENWRLFLSGFVKSAGEHPTDAAYLLMADCKQALAGIVAAKVRQKVLNGLATDLIIFPGTVLPPDPERAPGKIQFILQLNVRLVDDAANPY